MDLKEAISKVPYYCLRRFIKKKSDRRNIRAESPQSLKLFWVMYLLNYPLFPIYYLVSPSYDSSASPVHYKRILVESSWVFQTVSTEKLCFAGFPSNSQAASDHYCSNFEAEYFTSAACHMLLFFAYLAIPEVFASSSSNFFITASVDLELSSGKKQWPWFYCLWML